MGIEEENYGFKTHPEEWPVCELAEFLVEKEVYPDMGTALLSDRSDLIQEVIYYAEEVLAY